LTDNTVLAKIQIKIDPRRAGIVAVDEHLTDTECCALTVIGDARSDFVPNWRPNRRQS
jgi:hypothetical protein